MSEDIVIVKREPPLAWVIMNRPKANALNVALINALDKAFDDLWFDQEVHVVILMGAGEKFFSAGADLKEPPTLTLGVPAAVAQMDTALLMAKLTTKIERFPKIVIAAIRGYALGGGCELACACDFRIAAEGSRLGQPEVERGIIPGWGGTMRLPRLIGLAKAKELILSGEPVDAQEAYRIGLVNKVLSFENFEEEVKEYALKLAKGPPIAQRVAKYALNFGTQGPLDAGLIFEGALATIATISEDAKEGVMAFLEKREPKFKGA
ncbi:MAG: enoyl-CoA hydratase/isomerase family protein [Candidatus Freyrarchaeum guaymaensis]|nr:enoyl-CoA hydratase-related protein [Candidatus Freyarchaeota archaeon]MDO8089318.1 enoyl-CoA hydratase-related protein [Candidatus Sigynarchaeota archaeon]